MQGIHLVERQNQPSRGSPGGSHGGAAEPVAPAFPWCSACRSPGEMPERAHSFQDSPSLAQDFLYWGPTGLGALFGISSFW